MSDLFSKISRQRIGASRGYKTKPEFRHFFSGYVEAALWASTDYSDESGGEPLDKNYDESDIAPSAIKEMRKEAADFFQANFGDLEKYVEESGLDFSYAGHDFWLTRNRHGAGFWDRGLGRLGDKLTKEAHAYGTSNLYVGDDGRIYVS